MGKLVGLRLRQDARGANRRCGPHARAPTSGSHGTAAPSVAFLCRRSCYAPCSHTHSLFNPCRLDWHGHSARHFAVDWLQAGSPLTGPRGRAAVLTALSLRGGSTRACECESALVSPDGPCLLAPWHPQYTFKPEGSRCLYFFGKSGTARRPSARLYGRWSCL